MNTVTPNTTKSNSQKLDKDLLAVKQILDEQPIPEDIGFTIYIKGKEYPVEPISSNKCYVGKDGNAHHENCNHPNWNFKYKG